MMSLLLAEVFVGASFAMNLAQQTKDSGYSILVVEAVDSKNFDQQPSFDSRSTALSFGKQADFRDHEAVVGDCPAC